ncbi:hypothetical protein J9874_03178 [Duffyella gerundensis]|nr:hypothetical protein J9874_03178 [Duffyella gerundensis]
MNGKFHLNTKSVEDISSLYEMVHRRGGCAWRQAAFKVKVQGHFVQAEACPGRARSKARSKAISFCLKAGGLLRARSKAISYRLKPARAGPAVAPALHPRYPANTTARCAGALSKSVFLTDPARFAPGSARLLAASLRLALENAFPSAFVMPPQGQNPGQGQRRFRSA